MMKLTFDALCAADDVSSQFHALQEDHEDLLVLVAMQVSPVVSRNSPRTLLTATCTVFTAGFHTQVA